MPLELSVPILERKLVYIEKTGVPLVLIDCPGCCVRTEQDMGDESLVELRLHSPAAALSPVHNLADLSLTIWRSSARHAELNSLSLSALPASAAALISSNDTFGSP